MACLSLVSPQAEPETGFAFIWVIEGELAGENFQVKEWGERIGKGRSWGC